MCVRMRELFVYYDMGLSANTQFSQYRSNQARS